MISRPNFIIHAAGSLGNRPDLGKQAHRLHCHFRIEAHPKPWALELAKRKAAEQFIVDMRTQGWEFMGESGRLPPAERGFRMKFYGAYVPVVNPGRPKRPPSSREMLPHVMQGAKFRSTEEPTVLDVPSPAMTEFWEYDISAVFIHTTILAEIPDLHEERRPR